MSLILNHLARKAQGWELNPGLTLSQTTFLIPAATWGSTHATAYSYGHKINNNMDNGNRSYETNSCFLSTSVQ